MFTTGTVYAVKIPTPVTSCCRSRNGDAATGRQAAQELGMVGNDAAGSPSAMQELPTGSEAPLLLGKAEVHRPHYLIVVSRDQPDLWRHLRQMFTGIGGVDVVLDRRHGGRWQWAQSRAFEERNDDRRRAHTMDTSLSHRSFVIVNPEVTATSPGA